MIFEEQFPVPRYTAASKIGNSVISLLWQLRWRCNTDHNKFSSLSHTTVVAIFPKLCFWRRSLCSNLRGIDPKNCIEPPYIAPDVTGKDRRKWIYSLRIDSAERFAFSFMYRNTQFRTKTQSTFRMKEVDSSLLVRFHRSIKVTLKHSK